MAGLSLVLPLSHTGLLPFPKAARQPKPAQHKLPAPPPTASYLSAEDDQFLDEVEKASFLYLLGTRQPANGTGKRPLQHPLH